MRPRLDLVLVGLGGGENFSLRRKRRGARAAMIAGAVGPLVVCAHDRAEPRERRRARQHALAVIGMQAHLLPVAVTEGGGLQPDARRHRHLADIVQQAGAGEIDGVAPRQPAAARGLARERGNATRMTARSTAI